jgi:NAD(P)-dependent dehydrogenase (short-subunit alcohol dehydrogenase family)
VDREAPVSPPGFRLAEALREVAGALAYPAIGHRLHRRRFHPEDLDVDLDGRVCVVTGASSGLGLALSRGLAARHAVVVMVSRDPARAEAARRIVGGRARLELADLSSVAAVHDLAGRIAARYERVDVLVNNAGLSIWELRTTADGLESTFATNVLGGFVLTHLLLPLLRRAAPARVVHMTSAALYVQRLDVDALVAGGRPYRGAIQYALTKRAQVELGALWAERLSGTGVTSSCVHPGLAVTPGVANAAPFYYRFAGPALRSASQGADTALWLAVSRAAAGRSGELWFDRTPRPLHVVPWTRSPRVEAERLWAACTSLGRVEAAA